MKKLPAFGNLRGAANVTRRHNHQTALKQVSTSSDEGSDFAKRAASRWLSDGQVPPTIRGLPSLHFKQVTREMPDLRPALIPNIRSQATGFSVDAKRAILTHGAETASVTYAY